jgi:hypothetical protein
MDLEEGERALGTWPCCLPLRLNLHTGVYIAVWQRL